MGVGNIIKIHAEFSIKDIIESVRGGREEEEEEEEVVIKNQKTDSETEMK